MATLLADRHFDSQHGTVVTNGQNNPISQRKMLQLITSAYIYASINLKNGMKAILLNSIQFELVVFSYARARATGAHTIKKR